MKIRTKMTALFTVFLILLAFSVAFSIITVTSNILKDQIDEELMNLTESIKITVKTNIDTSIKNYLRSIAEKNLDIIKMFSDKIDNQDKLRDAVRPVLFSQKIGKTGYLYILDISQAPKKITVEMHPKLKRGINVTKFQFIQDSAKLKNGYMEYMWKNPDEKKKHKKAMYLTYFKKYNWLICASTYKREFFNLVNVNDFREDLLKLKIGKDGYPAVMDKKGTLIIHPKIQGKNIYNVKDGNGKYFAREVIRRKEGKLIYSWKNPDDDAYRDKIGYFAHVESLDWFIWLSAYKDEIYTKISTVTKYLIVIFIIALIVSIPLIWLFSRKLTQPLTKIKIRTDELAQGQGDLTKSIDIKANDETGDLSSSFNSFVSLVRKIVVDIKSSSNRVSEIIERLDGLFEESSQTVENFNDNIQEISLGAKKHASYVEEAVSAMTEIKENINSLSANIGSQSSTIEQFSSTIEEMMAQIKNIAGITEEGKTISENLNDAANKGSTVIQNVIEGVREIEVSSNQIKDIMGVITGITEQTNLLAMNAAIEAAHAGDYGKGFAVVADEIRKLAENSQQSSKEITGLIQDILNKINNTAKFATESEESLKRIVEDVNRTNDINEEIYSSTQEQSSGANQILSAVQSINEITSEIKSAVNGVQDGSKDVMKTVYELKELTDEITGTTEKQAQGAQEILESVEHEKNYIDNIQNAMKDMEKSINRFKVEGDNSNGTEQENNEKQITPVNE